MKTSWQTDADHIVCRWSDAENTIPYRPPWLQEAAEGDEIASDLMPDFTRHSPLGSGEWFVPWHARWMVPGRRLL